MKIAIITPSYPPSIGGNATTSARLVDGLKAKGIRTIVFLPEQLKERKSLGKLGEFKPDIVHAFHAYKSGIAGAEISKKLGIPLVVTITGTDVNINLFQEEKKAKVKEVLGLAKSIVVFHKSMGEKMEKEAPKLKNKISIIKQTVKLKHTHCNIRKKLGLKKNDSIFFLPAAIRAIKYQNFHLEEFIKLNEKYDVKLLLAGSVLDNDFAQGFFKKIKGMEWVYYIPKIPHNEMECVFGGIDVSLNTSITEGGMANAVLEAMSVGKPVLASAIDGNKSIIKDGHNGLIFKDAKDFYKKAEKLVLDRKLRGNLGRNAKKYIKENFHYRDEIDGYVDIYTRAMG